jgi:divalent metal cation (Fe/Co/Zn/Cd) transporter
MEYRTDIIVILSVVIGILLFYFAFVPTGIPDVVGSDNLIVAGVVACVIAVAVFIYPPDRFGGI